MMKSKGSARIRLKKDGSASPNMMLVWSPPAFPLGRTPSVGYVAALAGWIAPSKRPLGRLDPRQGVRTGG